MVVREETAGVGLGILHWSDMTNVQGQDSQALSILKFFLVSCEWYTLELSIQSLENGKNRHCKPILQ